MTTPPTTTTAAGTAPNPDRDALRDAGVPFFEETVVVPEEQFELLAESNDMAPVGVENDAGEVLLMRVTDSCERKIPSPAVPPGEEYATAARRWVHRQAGLDVTLDAVAGVWTVVARPEGEGDEGREATRNFVVFAATPATATDAGPDAGEATDVGWFETLPDDAERPPGTDRFFE